MFYKRTIINILVLSYIGNRGPDFKTSINYSVFILFKTSLNNLFTNIFLLIITIIFYCMCIKVVLNLLRMIFQERGRKIRLYFYINFKLHSILEIANITV